MNRELFLQMLTSRAELARSGDTFTVVEPHEVELLLKSTSGGPAPLPKVRSVELCDAFISAVVGESTYCLPFELVAGLKVTSRQAKLSSRTGFRAD